MPQADARPKSKAHDSDFGFGRWSLVIPRVLVIGHWSFGKAL